MIGSPRDVGGDLGAAGEEVPEELDVTMLLRLRNSVVDMELGVFQIA